MTRNPFGQIRCRSPGFCTSLAVPLSHHRFVEGLREEADCLQCASQPLRVCQCPCMRRRAASYRKAPSGVPPARLRPAGQVWCHATQTSNPSSFRFFQIVIIVFIVIMVLVLVGIIVVRSVAVAFLGRVRADQSIRVIHRSNVGRLGSTCRNRSPISTLLLNVSMSSTRSAGLLGQLCAGLFGLPITMILHGDLRFCSFTVCQIVQSCQLSGSPIAHSGIPE